MGSTHEHKRRSESAAEGGRVLASPPGTFLRRKDFTGSDRSVEPALSRLALAGELVRVRRGVYYRGKQTRLGMTRPSVLESAIAVGGPDTGPAGVSAAHMLELATQVPGVVEVGVPGKVPDPMTGVRFRLRPFERRELGLTAIEVAVIEILRDPDAVEAADDEVRGRLRELIRRGAARAELIAEEVTEERHVGARRRWHELKVAA